MNTRARGARSRRESVWLTIEHRRIDLQPSMALPGGPPHRKERIRYAMGVQYRRLRRLRAIPDPTMRRLDGHYNSLGRSIQKMEGV